MLGSSELEVISDSDPTLVKMNIYELQNLLEYPFIGDLKMILADKSGNQLCSFGDSIQPGELSTFEVQEEPIKIQGRLVGEWPEGDYRLYVGARQLNTSKFVYLSYYDIVHPDISYHDLSLSAQIKGNKLIINGKTYIITPTKIELVEANNSIEELDYYHVYSLNGRHIGSLEKKNPPPGIYIIRQGQLWRKIIVK